MKLSGSRPKQASARRKPEAQAGRLTLLFDADDTLWENNIHFMEVTEHLQDALASFGIDRDAASSLLTETEKKNILAHGYGARSFARSIAETFEALCPSEQNGTVERLRSLAEGIFERDTVDLRPGAQEALGLLSLHHRLFLVTKGHEEEQRRKVAISGLSQYFDQVEIVHEKDVSVYSELIRRLELDPDRTWMIGNSPRSDINPAMAAGLKAVLIPHPNTWELELEELDMSREGLLVFDSLLDVAQYFRGTGELPAAT
jgi:putative hydrolase of the HAD superfamily